MKKIVLSLVILLAGFVNGSAQVNTLVEAPQNNASTTGFRAPNGTSAYAFMRACALVLPAELTNIPVGTTINAFGFTLSAGASIPVAGNFTLYLQNTSDVTYLKGTNFPAAIAGMTVAYASIMTIPQAVGTASILLTLSTPVTYTGGGLYVAYDWASSGPYSTSNALYLAENGQILTVGCASGGSTTTPPVTLGTTNFRPSFLFGFPNPNSNDIQVVGLETPGRIPLLYNTPHTIAGVIRNTSNITKTNITVSLTVAGVNPVATTQNIPSLAAGAYTTVTFGPYNPQVPGANSISVAVVADQNNNNNLSTYTQSITCNTFAQNPATGNYTGNNTGLGVNAGLVVSKLVNPVSSTLTSINFGVSNDPNSVGNSIYGVLLSSTGATLATTNTITITSGILGSMQTFSFITAQALSSGGTYYYGFAQPANVLQYYPAGTFVSPYITPNIYFTAPITGGLLTAVAVNSGYPYLEAVLYHPMSISITPTITCGGSPVNIVLTGPTSYTWSQGSTTIGTSQNITVFPLVSTVYSFVGTNTLGCNFSGSYTLSVNPLPNVSVAAATNSICIGSSITFTANGAPSYSLNGVTTTSVITQIPASTTTYTVAGMDANNCVNTAIYSVSVETLTVSVPSNTAICKGKNIALTASGQSNYTYNWNTGTINIAIAGIIVTPTVTSTYTLTTTDGYCTQVTPVTVTVNPVPTVTLTSANPVICKGESVTISGNSTGTYAWNNNISTTTASISVSPSLTTIYNATVTNVQGCSGTAVISQVVMICTSINEASSVKSVINIFPNPNNGSFVISTDNSEITKTVEIYNAIGSVIKRVELNATTAQVDLTKEANGIYFVKIIENNKIVQVSKIVKH